jgi:hypothetical protein
MHFLSRETASAAYAVYAGSKDPATAIASGVENAGYLFDAVEQLSNELPESLPEGEMFDVEDIIESLLQLVIEQRDLAADAATAYAVRTHFSRHSFVITALRSAIIGEAAASARNATQQAPTAPAAGTWPQAQPQAPQRRTGARTEWHEDDGF